jgi:cytochrome c-type biogenesis protein CcmE
VEENIINAPENGDANSPSRGKMKFIIGGGIIAAAIVYLIISSTQANAQYFLTVAELQAKASQFAGQNVRVSGAVLGDTIQYDAQKLELRFTVAQIPGDQKEIDRLGGMAQVLHTASLDSSLPRLNVIYNDVKPDLLKNEAQAIMTGKMGNDGIFYADELLLKCPTRYEDKVPEQTK